MLLVKIVHTKISEFTVPAILTAIRTSTFTYVGQMAKLHVYAINIYKIDLLFKWTLARDQHHGLLIASFNEKYYVFILQNWL